MEPTNCKFCGDEFVPKTSLNTICSKEACKKAGRRARYAAWVQAHPDGQKESARRWRMLNPDKAGNWPTKQENAKRVEELKEATPCTDCNGTFPACCMDFDHVADDKLNNVGTMVSHGWSWEKIEAEIAKCELVCANCHRIRTRDRRKK